MSDYRPDKWLVVKITGKDTAPVHKVFASWYGGWAGSDSWKLNSGNTKATLVGDVYYFDGYSGSVYECHKDEYGYTSYGGSVLTDIIQKAEQNGVKIEIMPQETNWLEIKYE
jgi:hypothetical protein